MAWCSRAPQLITISWPCGSATRSWRVGSQRNSRTSLLIRHNHGWELAIDGARHATHAASRSRSWVESDIDSALGIDHTPIADIATNTW